MCVSVFPFLVARLIKSFAFALIENYILSFTSFYITLDSYKTRLEEVHLECHLTTNTSCSIAFFVVIAVHAIVEYFSPVADNALVSAGSLSLLLSPSYKESISFYSECLILIEMGKQYMNLLFTP